MGVGGFSPFTKACAACGLKKTCLPLGLDASEIEALGGLVEQAGPLTRGEYVFRQGAPFRSLFIVRSGSIKNYITTADGAEQIVGFYLPSEILGLDAIGPGRYTSSAVALAQSALCELPYRRFNELCIRSPRLHDEVVSRFSRELAEQHDILLLLAQKSASERLAYFLYDMSRRMKAQGFSATDFELSMPRHDIANFLGVAAETVSRVLAQFEQERILSVERKRIMIHDSEKLRTGFRACGDCDALIAR